jgi:hypothetical protein
MFGIGLAVSLLASSSSRHNKRAKAQLVDLKGYGFYP